LAATRCAAASMSLNGLPADGWCSAFAGRPRTALRGGRAGPPSGQIPITPTCDTYIAPVAPTDSNSFDGQSLCRAECPASRTRLHLRHSSAPPIRVQGRYGIRRGARLRSAPGSHCQRSDARAARDVLRLPVPPTFATSVDRRGEWHVQATTTMAGHERPILRSTPGDYIARA